MWECKEPWCGPGLFLSFKFHMDSVTKTCNFHIRNLYMIRNFISRRNLTTLVHSLIVSKVDYCNSLFVGLSNVTSKKLKSILNRAARLIYFLPPRVHITPYLIELHWLPVKARIEFKVCLIFFKALKFNQPSYIENSCIVLSMSLLWICVVWRTLIVFMNPEQSVREVLLVDPSLILPHVYIINCQCHWSRLTPYMLSRVTLKLISFVRHTMSLINQCVKNMHCSL